EVANDLKDDGRRANTYLSGYVGIGTTTPSAKLSILNLTSNPSFLIEDSASPDATPFIVDASGKVGVGTTSPASLLSVAGIAGWDSSAPIALIENLDQSNAQGNGLHIRAGWSASDYLFKATHFASTDVDRFIIKPTGNVGVATTSPWRTLSVTGTVGFDGLTGTTGAGSVCLDANKQLVYNSGSDACLSSTRATKHDITALDLSGLDLLSVLEPVSFVYNDSNGQVRYGFIAEDAGAVDPHFATYNASGTISGIDDRAIISVIVKAIKELWAYVTGHDAQIAALESRVAWLESQLASSASAQPGAIEANQADAPIAIIINGNSPAELTVGESYVDLGATASSSDLTLLALGIRTFVDGSEVQTVVIDTSSAGTSTVTYKIINAEGALVASAERTVIVSPVASPVQLPPTDESAE
nr:DUF5011 domain-containing protein [Candidatus Paceibacterota bacterium]